MHSQNPFAQPDADTELLDAVQRILIIEDDEQLAEPLAIRLRGQGYEVSTAHTGQDGWQLAISERPDLILLDIRLPDVDGFTLCGQLADSSDTCHIPVIIVSGMERPDIIRRCRKAGSQYFIRKPYDPNALLVLIRNALDEAQRWQPA
jgi:DNA-binding response OmpR family regulator